MLVYTFDTVSQVLTFEKALKKAGVPVTLRPVPRHLSSSCGTCAVVPPEQGEAVSALIKEHNLTYHEMHDTEE